MAKRNPATDVSTEVQTGPPDLSDHVSRRAYDLFLARGGEHGRDLDDWTQAERELAVGSENGGDRESNEP